MEMMDRYEVDFDKLGVGLPTRRVWVRSFGGRLKTGPSTKYVTWPESQMPELDVALERPEGPEWESWTEVGEFGRICQRCGVRQPDLAFAARLDTRKLYVIPKKCFCPVTPESREALRLARVKSYLEGTANPDAEAIKIARSATDLPARFHPGLSWLDRDENNEKAIGLCEKFYLDWQGGQKPRGLFLFGDVGTGKTSMTKALCYQLWTQTGDIFLPGVQNPIASWGPRAHPVWYTAPELFEQITKSAKGEATFDENRLRKANPLFIDDLGKETMTDFRLAALFRLINHRCDEGTSIVITSQYTPIGLAKRWQSFNISPVDTRAISDRIIEMCDGGKAVASLRGESRRLVAGRQRV